MRILHVNSDWKWTGPAEPMLGLLREQRRRGLEADLVCPEAPDGASGGVAARAREAGVAPLLALERGRGARPWRDRRDARRLRGLLEEGSPDIVHVWHTRDHVLAWRARRGRRTPVVVRSLSSADPPRSRPWSRWLLGQAADGLICTSGGAAAAARRLAPGRPVRALLGAVDLERFAPSAGAGDVRARLGLGPGDEVVGVVARVQRHRRFDLLLEAMRRLAERRPSARLLVIGRGTHLDSVARRPAHALGISDRVVFAGYRGEDYPDVLRGLDLLTFLVPGSDGTCRAVLEAHAAGVPVVTSRRGALPEIVIEGHTGRLVDEDPDALCAAWEQLLAQPEKRRAMGRAARARAERHFAPQRLASEVLELYADAASRA